MARVCDVCGKGPQFGNNISHAHNVTKRRWEVNLRPVKARLKSYQEHNESQRAPELVDAMRRGAVVALVSYAGMPLVSDPGFVLVRASVAAGLAVEVLPGPSAALEALVGLPQGHIFHGELSADQLFWQRPAAHWAAYRTPIAGLYLCGSSAHPGGGVSGIPGHNAAREIRRDWRRLRLRRSV